MNNNQIDQESNSNEIIVVNDNQLSKNNSIMPLDAQALIAQAIDKNTSIETMERLLAMRRELKAEAAKDAYFQALAIFQSKCPIIRKKRPVYDKEGNLRYKRADLEDIVSQVKKLLLECGFSYTIKTKQDKESVTAICISHHRFGHEESTSFTCPIDNKAYMNIAQKAASALTFAKRYAFCDAFGIITADEDDDGESSSKKQKPKIQNQIKKQQTNSISEENRALYGALMALLQEKENNIVLFVEKEKIENKNKADAVLNNYEKLKELYKIINKIAQERRATIKNNKL